MHRSKGRLQVSPLRICVLAGILLFLNQPAFAVAPTIVSAIPDTTVNEDNPAFDYRDLNDIFDDVEDDNNLTFTVESNSNPGLVTATMQNGTPTNTGFKNPALTGDDYTQWSNPTDAFTSNDLDASEATDGQQQDWYYFSFGLPAGPQIDGIEIDVEGAESGAGKAATDVELSWDGGTSYTTTSYTHEWGTTDAYFTFGSSSDTWGRTWVAAEFDSANFRVRLTKSGGV